MHVLQISFLVDPQRRPASRLLTDWPSLVDIAASARAAGLRVTVAQAHTREEFLEHDGIAFNFLSSNEHGVPLTQADGFVRWLRQTRPDLIHVHGLGFSHEVSALRTLAPHTPILLQDHADRVPRFWRRGAWRKGVSAANGVSFCARQQAEPFHDAGLLAPHLRIFEVPESTSRFTPGDREQARAATGIKGDPCVLWVGHLDANKDPLTVLEGVSAAAAELPGLELWCCFGSGPLLPQVRARIEADPRLRTRVHLLGRVAHPQVELLMRAADIFVLGSHREGSSFSLIEALATGLTPVVTDIPSLRALTDGGQVGALWAAGHAASCAEALQRVARASPDRGAVRAYFERELSFAALGRKWGAAYRELGGDRASVG